MYMRINAPQSIFSMQGIRSITQKERVTRKQESVDTLEISSNAKLYNIVRTALNQVPDVREDRIREVISKTQQNYDVPTEILVEKMFSKLDL